MRILSVGLILFALAFCSSCKDKTEEGKTFFITDDLGNNLSFTSRPARFISLAPSITETFYAINAGSMLVAVTDYCDYPPECKSKTKIGGILNPDFEKIASLNPDLIVLTVEGNSKNSFQSLKNFGYNVFVSNPRNIDGIIKMIKDIGKLSGKEKEADGICGEISGKRDSIANIRGKNINSNKTLFAVSVNPLISVNGTTFINEILELAGLVNVYKNEPMDYPQINFESATAVNPDLIVIPADTVNLNNIKNLRDELQSKLNVVNAVKSGRIIFIDENLLFRPGPRVMKSVENLRQKISGLL